MGCLRCTLMIWANCVDRQVLIFIAGGTAVVFCSQSLGLRIRRTLLSYCDGVFDHDCVLAIRDPYWITAAIFDGKSPAINGEICVASLIWIFHAIVLTGKTIDLNLFLGVCILCIIDAQICTPLKSVISAVKRQLLEGILYPITDTVCSVLFETSRLADVKPSLRIDLTHSVNAKQHDSTSNDFVPKLNFWPPLSSASSL